MEEEEEGVQVLVQAVPLHRWRLMFAPQKEMVSCNIVLVNMTAIDEK